MAAPTLVVQEPQVDSEAEAQALVMAAVAEVDTPVAAKAVAAVVRTTSEATNPTVEHITDTAT